MVELPITYLDHAATTPMRPEAVAAMLPFLSGSFGNPSGGHGAARAAKQALEEARERVAVDLGAAPSEVVFTAGGTEADNLAIEGAGRAARERGDGDGIVVGAVEHKAVLAAAARLGREGFPNRIAPVCRSGIIDLDRLADVLDERTVVVSVMLVNNEVGTIQPLEELAGLVRERAPRAVLHTDAVQAAPWLDVATLAADADLLSLSAHKLGGPKGVGALVVRGGTRVVPLIEGGGQESGLRAGTPNVAGAVAFGVALRASIATRDETNARVGALRDRLASGIEAAIPDVFVNGDAARKVAGNWHGGFRGVEAEALLVQLDREGLCAAAGSSCSSGASDPSHVLAAMGLPRSDALASIRLSLGFASSAVDADRALAVLPSVVERLRSATISAARR